MKRILYISSSTPPRRISSHRDYAPRIFHTQHQLRQKAVLDQGADSTLFLVEDPSHDEMLVEIYGPENRGVLRQSGIVGQLQHSAIAPIVGTGPMNSGQEFFVRRSLPGQQLSDFTSSGIGAQHLSRDEAIAVFAPLADATDFLLQDVEYGATVAFTLQTSAEELPGLQAWVAEATNGSCEVVEIGEEYVEVPVDQKDGAS